MFKLDLQIKSYMFCMQKIQSRVEIYFVKFDQGLIREQICGNTFTNIHM